MRWPLQMSGVLVHGGVPEVGADGVVGAGRPRLQVLSGPQGGASGVPGVRHTFWSTAAELYRQHGASGFFRGVKPRMMSVSIWGTTMVTTYEFLKRTSKMDT